MKNLVKILAVLAFVVFVVISPVQATPVLELSGDGGATWTSITDNLLGDLNPAQGAILYSVPPGGPLGGFSVIVSTGLTMPTIGTSALPEMDLAVVGTSSNAGSLLVRFTETGFGPLAPGIDGFQSAVGGTTQGTAHFWTYLDQTNTQFGTGTLLSDMGPFAGAFSDVDTLLISPTSPFSLTTVAQINHGGSVGTTSFDLHTTPIPEPSTLALLGSGILGGAGFYYGRLRRRK